MAHSPQERTGPDPASAGPLDSSERTGLLESARAELGPVLAGTVLPFALVLYLALQGGGYDSVVRSEIGIAVWWIVLLGALIGILPVVRPTAAAWAGLGLLGAFCAWTALGISWSESSERSVAEVARLATYLGVLALAISAQGRDGLRRTVGAIGAAIGVVAVLALLSRLHPSWFPADGTAAAFESARARLNYGLNYWNGLAALMAIGVPLLLAVAVESRRILSRALATAAIPVVALVAFFTLSRGGAGEIAIVLLAFVALFPRRLAALPVLALSAAGSTLLIVAATQRDALVDGLANPAAHEQGDEMLTIVIIVCAGVALGSAAVALAARRRLVRSPTVGRRATLAGFALATVLAATIAVAAGLPGEISDRWDEFKQPATGTLATDTVARFESVNSNGRYQLWDAALDAFSGDPATGIGPGGYEYYWARERSLPLFVRDAHSLYLETLAELGIVGFALVAGFLGTVIAVGTRRSFAVSTAQPWLAAATVACIAFAAAAAIDWVWELTVLPVALMLLAAGILGHREAEQPPRGRSRALSRAILATAAIASLIAIAIPLASTRSVRASQADVVANQLGAALDDAQTAGEIEPWAATPSLQEALVLELSGDLGLAAAAARAATEAESTNWRTWLVLSRIEAFRGNSKASIEAYRQARSLNPRSQLVARAD